MHEVAVFCGRCRHPQAHAETEERRLQKQQRNEQHTPIDRDVRALAGEEFVVAEHDGERRELQHEREQVRHDRRQRHDEAREIDLAEKLRIGRECRRARGDILREIIPREQSAQIKKRRGNAVCRNLRDATEHDDEHHRRQQRLHDKPRRPEERLFVFRQKIAAHQQHEQVAILPHLAPVDAQPATIRLDDDLVAGRGAGRCGCGFQFYHSADFVAGTETVVYAPLSSFHSRLKCACAKFFQHGFEFPSGTRVLFSLLKK